MTTEFHILPEYQNLVDKELLEQAVQCVLAAERAEGDVTIVITDDETVAELNLNFLGKDGPTDVLSFPAHNYEDDFALPPDEAISSYLGDVIIAMPFTQRQAQMAGRSLQNELALLVVHGVLHLLGYDHATDAEKDEMWSRQNAILSGLGIPPLQD